MYGLTMNRKTYCNKKRKYVAVINYSLLIRLLVAMIPLIKLFSRNQYMMEKGDI